MQTRVLAGTKQLLSCLPMSIGIYRKRMCRRKRHLRTCSGSSILKHPSLLFYSFFFCLSWFTEPLSFFKCYSENKYLYCSPLHFRTYCKYYMHEERERIRFDITQWLQDQNMNCDLRISFPKSFYRKKKKEHIYC